MGKIHKCAENRYLKDYVLENTKFLDVIPFKFTSGSITIERKSDL